MAIAAFDASLLNILFVCPFPVIYKYLQEGQYLSVDVL